MVTDEKQRPNNHISSLIYTRATVFYPSTKMTDTMKHRLMDVAGSGGTDIDKPLGSSKIKAYGKDLIVDLHGDYLLQTHRDILDCLLAFAKTIKLSDEAYESGKVMTWQNIFDTVGDGSPSTTTQDGFDSVFGRGSVVLSTSMYDLAKNLGITTHHSNYKIIERRIMQLASAMLVVSEIDEEGKVVDRKTVRIIKDFRFYHDKSKVKNQGIAKNNTTNHLFVVPDERLLQAIRDYGYLYRLEQAKFTHYRTPSLRSFLKFVLTNKGSFIHGKTLKWLVNQYIDSMLVEMSNPRRVRSTLIKDVLKQAVQIEEDFNIQFRTDPLDNVVRAYVVQDRGSNKEISSSGLEEDFIVINRSPLLKTDRERNNQRKIPVIDESENITIEGVERDNIEHEKDIRKVL
jgi:hypothetical protein